MNIKSILTRKNINQQNFNKNQQKKPQKTPKIVKNDFGVFSVDIYQQFVNRKNAKKRQKYYCKICYVTSNILSDYKINKPFFLSGGIGINSLKKFKRFLNSVISKNCVAIDINSQFEIDFGIKDFQLIKNFINEL